jgi:RNA polymerase sigma factor (sigma-70 family)
MASNPMRKIIQHLQRTALLGDGAGLTDGQLLERYLTQREDAAFAALVRRHGPMVMSVCRRVLGNDHDAEDAFQASFLVLVRKAASIVPREKVGNFLYGVAHTTSRRAKGLIVKRRAREKQMAEMPEAAARPQELWDDLRPLLDLELSRLPDKYRAPIVLCDLEDRPIKEAARQLGWPQGTLAGRLARARMMLAKRLARRGVTVSGGALAILLSQQARSSLVPMRIISGTLEAAKLFAAGQAASGLISAPVAALTEGVLKTMFLSKLKTATAVAVVTVASLAALGGGVATTHMVAAPQTKEERGDRAVPGRAELPDKQNQKEGPRGGGPNHLLGFDDGTDVSVILERVPEDYNVIFDNALDVVEDFFEVAYANRYDGLIKTQTQPEKSAASSPARRRAIVCITVEDSGGYRVHVQIRREAKITTSGFDNKISRPVTEKDWKFIGRDIEIEQAMLKRLIEQYRKEKSSELRTRKKGEEQVKHEDAGKPQNGIMLRNVQLDRVEPNRTICVTKLNNHATFVVNLPVARDAKIKVKGGNTFAALKIGRRLSLRLKVVDDQLVVTEIRQEGSSPPPLSPASRKREKE